MRGYLATACDDGFVRIFLALEGVEAIKVKVDTCVTDVDWSFDSNILASADAKGVRMWATNNGELIKSFDIGCVRYVKFSPNNNQLLCGLTDGTLKMIDISL